MQINGNNNNDNQILQFHDKHEIQRNDNNQSQVISAQMLRRKTKSNHLQIN